MIHQTDQAGNNTCINNLLNSGVLSVAEVGECPTSISEDFLVGFFHYNFAKNWGGISHIFEVREGFSSAEVTQGPSAVFDCILWLGSLNNLDEWINSSGSKFPQNWYLRMRSLYCAQSPAIFPMAQTACSAISVKGDESNLQKSAIPPLSMIV